MNSTSIGMCIYLLLSFLLLCDPRSILCNCGIFIGQVLSNLFSIICYDHAKVYCYVICNIYVISVCCFKLVDTAVGNPLLSTFNSTSPLKLAHHIDCAADVKKLCSSVSQANNFAIIDCLQSDYRVWHFFFKMFLL